MLRLALATVAILLLAVPVGAQAPVPVKASHLGKVLPEITSQDCSWLNAKEDVRLENLRGKPVLVTYTVLW